MDEDDAKEGADGNGEAASEETAAVADQQPDAEPDRQAQPVDVEEPPRLPYPVVAVGASAGAWPRSGSGAWLAARAPPFVSSSRRSATKTRNVSPARTARSGPSTDPEMATLPSLTETENSSDSALQRTSKRVPVTRTTSGPAITRQALEPECTTSAWRLPFSSARLT